MYGLIHPQFINPTPEILLFFIASSLVGIPKYSRSASDLYLVTNPQTAFFIYINI